MLIKYLNLVLLTGMIVMNYLANALPINNRRTGEISDSFPNLFVPAGITFSIWGIIYLLLIIYCVVQFTGPKQDYNTMVGWLFAISCLLNALWIVCWHYGKLQLSLLVMVGLLIVLIAAGTLIRNTPSLIVKASFGIYLGWICIATIANVTALLVSYQWKGFGISEEVWAIIMISTGALITVASIIRFNNPFIGISVIWAFTGIIIKRQNDYHSIVLTSVIALIIVGTVTVMLFMKKISPGIS
jgi:hypothetical protein